MAGGPYVYDYPRPMLTVDALVFAGPPGSRRVLLVRRGKAPFAGCWALPGGYVDMDEPLEDAARRELAEETGLRGVSLRQWRTFGTPGRDPRGRTVSVVYAGHAGASPPQVQGADDADDACWFSLDALPPLAFDHAEMVARAREELEKEWLS